MPILPNRSAYAIPPFVRSNKSTGEPITPGELSSFTQDLQKKFFSNDSGKFTSGMDNQTTNSMYKHKKAVLAGLKTIYDHYRSPISQSEKKAIAEALNEETFKCNEGFHNRVNTLVDGFYLPKTIPELLYRYRQDIAFRVANSMFQEVHSNNYVYRIEKDQWGITPPNPDDIYTGDRSVKIDRQLIKTTLLQEFTRRMALLPMLQGLKEKIYGLLTSYDYKGSSSSIYGQLKDKADKLFSTLFSGADIVRNLSKAQENYDQVSNKDNGEQLGQDQEAFDKFFYSLKDEAEAEYENEIKDINWPNIQHLLWQSVVSEQYFEIEPTVKNDFETFFDPAKTVEDRQKAFLKLFKKFKNIDDVTELLTLYPEMKENLKLVEEKDFSNFMASIQLPSDNYEKLMTKLGDCPLRNKILEQRVGNVAVNHALMSAFKQGHTETVKLLLSSSKKVVSTFLASIQFPSDNYEKLMSMLGDCKLSNEILNKSVGDADVIAPLMSAVEQGHPKTVKLLLSFIKNKNPILSNFLTHRNNAGYNIFDFAHQSGNIEIIKTILINLVTLTNEQQKECLSELPDKHKGVSYEYPNVLFYAAYQQPKLFDDLVTNISKNNENAASIFATRDDFGNTPLTIADELGQDQAIQKILMKLATLPTEKQAECLRKQKPPYTYPNVLFYAAEHHHDLFTKLLNELIENKEENHVASILNTTDAYGVTPLMLAAKHGVNESIEPLLSRGADIQAKDSDGNTALHHAASIEGNTLIIQKLLENETGKQTINAQNSVGNTALMSAVYNRQHDTVALLVNNGADVNVKNNEGKTAFDMAIEFDKPALIEPFLTKLATLSPEKQKECLPVVLTDRDNGVSYEYPNVLFYAGYKQSILFDDLVTNISKNKENAASLFATSDRLGNTPLMLAVLCRKNQAIQKILESIEPSAITVRNVQGMNALDWAIEGKNSTCIQLLLMKLATLPTEKQAECLPKKKSRPRYTYPNVLFYAAEHHKELFTKLLDKLIENKEKKDVASILNTTDAYGVTPLMLAAKHGVNESIEPLLSRGADIQAKDSDGNTALHHAASIEGNTLIIEKLLKNETSKQVINAQNSIGNTALMSAFYDGHHDKVALLVNNGADVNVTNNYDPTTTLLMSAVTQGTNRYSSKKDIETIELLIAKGADIGAKIGAKNEKEKGTTAFDMAIKSGKPAIIEPFVTKLATLSPEKQQECLSPNVLFYAAEHHTKLFTQLLNKLIENKETFNQYLDFAIKGKNSIYIQLLLMKLATLPTKEQAERLPNKESKPPYTYPNVLFYAAEHHKDLFTKLLYDLIENKETFNPLLQQIQALFQHYLKLKAEAPKGPKTAALAELLKTTTEELINLSKKEEHKKDDFFTFKRNYQDAIETARDPLTENKGCGIFLCFSSMFGFNAYLSILKKLQSELEKLKECSAENSSSGSNTNAPSG